MSRLTSFSGVVPSLAQIADFGPPRSECGVRCLMPWNGKRYGLNDVSHRRTFVPGFSAHWLRITADANCTATAQRTYT